MPRVPELDKLVEEVVVHMRHGTLDDYLDQFAVAIKARRIAIRDQKIRERFAGAQIGDTYVLSDRSYPVVLRRAEVKLTELDLEQGVASTEVLTAQTQTGCNFIGEVITLPIEYLLDTE